MRMIFLLVNFTSAPSTVIADLAEIEEELDAVNTALATTNTALATSNSLLAEIEDELDTANTALATANTKLTEIEEEQDLQTTALQELQSQNDSFIIPDLDSILGELAVIDDSINSTTANVITEIQKGFGDSVFNHSLDSNTAGNLSFPEVDVTDNAHGKIFNAKNVLVNVAAEGAGWTSADIKVKFGYKNPTTSKVIFNAYEMNIAYVGADIQTIDNFEATPQLIPFNVYKVIVTNAVTTGASLLDIDIRLTTA